MRLVTYIDGKGIEKIGLHTGELGHGTIVDIAQAALVVSSDLDGWKPPSDMISVIKTEDESLPQLQLILQKALDNELPKNVLHPEAEVTLISPIPHPASMRDGYAFRQHVEAARRNRGAEMIAEFDQFPIFYFTNHLAVTGPGDLPVQKLTLQKLDFELEAAIVIGKGGKNILSSTADQHIFGYMIMNDWSARHLQMEEMKLNLGPAKGKDFATSLGPYLVTRDEMSPFLIPSAQGERYNRKMKCWVNGNLLSEGNLKDMTWTFAQIVERASYGVCLHPGEVIGSGTVGTGCFLELNGSKITNNQWLKPGDEVVMEIESLGRLINTVCEAEPTSLDHTLPQ